MSIDALQEKIRKRKCPLIVDMTVLPKDLPGEGSIGELEQLSKELLRALRGRVPGVRFRLSALALMGPEALDLGKRLTQEAQGLGCYVRLDVPEADSGELAAFAAGQITGEGSGWACDGVVLPMYAGFDVLQPWLEPCEKQGLDIFALCRTSNRSAAELQDLLCGTRLAYTAVGPGGQICRKLRGKVRLLQDLPHCRGGNPCQRQKSSGKVSQPVSPGRRHGHHRSQL